MIKIFAFFRVFFWVYVAFCVFLFVFAESNVWEPRIVEEKRGDFVFLKKEPALHWDRFPLYIRNIPGELTNRMNWFKVR